MYTSSRPSLALPPAAATGSVTPEVLSVPNSGRSSRMSFKGRYGGSPRPGTGGGSASPSRRPSQQIALESLSSPLCGPLTAELRAGGVSSPECSLPRASGGASPVLQIALDAVAREKERSREAEANGNAATATTAGVLAPDVASPFTPCRQRTFSSHGSPSASALKAKKRSNFSSLLSSGGGLYSSERLLDSGTKFPMVAESAADYKDCCHAVADSEVEGGGGEARLDPTQTVVLQCSYSYEGGEEAIARYATDDEAAGRIDASLTVTGHRVVDAHAEMGRYAARHDDDDDGACGCSAEEITRNDRGFDYSRFHTHQLFKECYMCGRQPAAFLCLTSLKAVCASHVEAHYAADERNSLFINLMDIATSYDRMFWCERCRRFTWKHTDVFEAFTDQLAYTRGTYWGSAIRDIAATAYHARCAPTTPNSHDGLHLCAVAATSQGWRATQEDAEAVFLLRVPAFGGAGARRGIEHMCVFAVFDGHGGDAVARIAACRIEHALQSRLVAIAKERRAAVPDELEDMRAFYAEVFEDALVALDSEIRGSVEGRRGDYNCVGSTACIVGVTNSYIVCANLGDSGAALYSRHDAALVQLSHTHRLADAAETARVEAAGYSVRDGRIEGLLAVPRALGDYEFKQTMGTPREQAVIACPTVRVVRTPPALSHRQRDDGTTPIPWGLVIACDGVWDTLTLPQVSKVTGTFSLSTAAVVREAIASGAIPPCLPEPLLPNLLRVYAQCIAPTNNNEGVGIDNVSVIFVEPCPLAKRRVSDVGLAGVAY